MLTYFSRLIFYAYGVILSYHMSLFLWLTATEFRSFLLQISMLTTVPKDLLIAAYKSGR
jgi:hypothetical protein